MIPRSKQPNESDHTADEDKEIAERQLASTTDFSDEELALARDLQQLFPVDQEQLPPYFIQTLANDQGAWAAPTGLEQRVTYRVFHRLRLPRRLFAPQNTAHEDEPRGLRPLRGAPRNVAVSLMLALMILSLVTVAPTFAQGVRILLGQTGVQLAPHYPQTSLAPQDQTQYLSLSEVRQDVPFPVYWLGAAPASYQYQGLLLHMGQPWADGPVVELQYAFTDPVEGYRQVSVREFRPTTGATVLQVVADGAAHSVQVGNQPAIYIDGHWVQTHQAIIWRSGTHAELLYQAYGLVFWITADQRNGATAGELEALAQALERFPLEQSHPHVPELIVPPQAQVAAALSSAQLGEVVALLPAGVSPQTGSAVYIALGAPPDEMN